MPTEPLTDGVPRTSPPRWLTDEEQRAWRAYIRLARLLMRQLDRDLNPFGLSMHDYEILVELSEAPRHRMRMTELADRTAQSRSRGRPRSARSRRSMWPACAGTSSTSSIRSSSPP